MIGRLLVRAVVDILQLVGIAQIAVVGLSADNPVVGVVGEVEGSYQHLPLILRIHAVGVLRIAVADALAVIAAQAQTKAGDRIVVQSEGYTIFISYFELQRIGCSLLDPVGVSKVVGVKASQQLRLVTELPVTAEERHTRLVPRRGQDGVLTLRTIDGEEVQRFVVGVVQTDRHHDMPEAEIGCTRKGLLNPELLQLHLAAFLGLLFPLAAFLVFLLVGQTGATVLELNLRT